jgi:hypothetical protein
MDNNVRELAEQLCEVVEDAYGDARPIGKHELRHARALRGALALLSQQDVIHPGANIEARCSCGWRGLASEASGHLPPAPMRPIKV